MAHYSGSCPSGEPGRAAWHARATRLARHGVSPKVLSARLGRSGIGITHDLYAHVLPGAQKEAARWIESALLDKV